MYKNWKGSIGLRKKRHFKNQKKKIIKIIEYCTVTIETNLKKKYEEVHETSQ